MKCFGEVHFDPSNVNFIKLCKSTKENTYENFSIQKITKSYASCNPTEILSGHRTLTCYTFTTGTKYAQGYFATTVSCFIINPTTRHFSCADPKKPKIITVNVLETGDSYSLCTGARNIGICLRKYSLTLLHSTM